MFFMSCGGHAMMIREAVVAGSWYPGDAGACRRAIEAMRAASAKAAGRMAAAAEPKAPPPAQRPAEADLPARPVAGILPHAGWTFSGPTAVAALDAIRSRRTPQTFVIFGFHHRRAIRRCAIFPSGGWETPLGLAEVDERMARELLARAADLLDDNPRAHEDEHSIEIQAPLIRHLFPEARIVPILVPPTDAAAALGRAVGQAIKDLEADAVCLGSTDLTHYGPGYGFAPKGTGPAAIKWMREENDRRMVDLMARLDAEGVLAEAREHQNACGPGAVAAALAAARVLGAARGTVVQYTTSADVMRQEMGRLETDMAVGYVGMVF